MQFRLFTGERLLIMNGGGIANWWVFLIKARNKCDNEREVM